MVKKTYLVLTNELGKVSSVVEFVDDQRPALNISKRTATIYENHGCTFNEEDKIFETKEEGNDFFNELKEQGFYLDNKAGKEFIEKLYNSMY